MIEENILMFALIDIYFLTGLEFTSVFIKHFSCLLAENFPHPHTRTKKNAKL